MVVAAVLIGIARVRAAGIRQVEHMVHLCGGQRNGRRRNPHVAGGVAFAVRLHQAAGIARVGFQVQHAVGVGVEHSILLDLLIAGQANHAFVAWRHFVGALATQGWIGHKSQRLNDGLKSGLHGAGLGQSRRQIGFNIFGVVSLGHFLGLFFAGASGALLSRLVRNHQIRVDVRFHMAGGVHTGGVDLEPALGRFTTHKGGAAYIGDLLHRLAGGQAVGDFDNRSLGVAVQQQIALAVHHHRAAHLVRPVVVVRDAAQAAFNATEHNGRLREGFAAALAVNNGSAVGPLTAHVARCVSVICADFAVRRVAVDHGIHVAAGHAPKQVGLA